MSFEELNVPKNHIYLFKPQRRFCRGEIGVWNGRKGEMFGIIYA